MNWMFVAACCDKITCREKNLKFFFFDFVNKKVLMPFTMIYIYVCIFTMMYLFVNCICMKYINSHIHQELNLRLRGSTQKFKPPLQNFIDKQEKV